VGGCFGADVFVRWDGHGGSRCRRGNRRFRNGYRRSRDFTALVRSLGRLVSILRPPQLRSGVGAWLIAVVGILEARLQSNACTFAGVVVGAVVYGKRTTIESSRGDRCASCGQGVRFVFLHREVMRNVDDTAVTCLSCRGSALWSLLPLFAKRSSDGAGRAGSQDHVAAVGAGAR